MRNRREESGDAGYDSFLDIVSNMVGILIVLVMVVGIRAGKAPLPVIEPADLPPGTSSPDEVSERIAAERATADEALVRQRQRLESASAENTQLAARIAGREAERIAQRDGAAAQRAQDAAMSEELRRAIVQNEAELTRLAGERARLDAVPGAAEAPPSASEIAAAEERRTGLEQELYALRIESQDLRRRLQDPAIGATASAIGVSATPAAPLKPGDSPVVPVRATVTRESYPTPVGRVVSGPERHYQLRGGRLAEVPIDALTQLVLENARAQVNKLADRMVPFDHSSLGDNRGMREVGDIVGPIDGFRMRYVMRRVDRTVSTPNGRTRESGVELAGWTVVPVYAEQGETGDEIFRPDSKFIRSLRGASPRNCTLTFWVFEDSFEEFHAIRKWAHENGWSVACRPLPDDCPISGSPDGARSESS